MCVIFEPSPSKKGELEMEQKALSRWLKWILIGMALCGVMVYGVAFPTLGRMIADYEEGMYDHCYWPWLIFLWCSGIPCYAILAVCWKIASNIGKEQAFSMDNARLFRYISRLAAGDSVFFFIGNVVYWLIGYSHPGIVLESLFPIFAGVAISVGTGGLSQLVQKAAVLQEQSDLTI